MCYTKLLRILREAQRVLAAVKAAGYMGPNSLAEVEVTALLDELDSYNFV